MAWLSVISSILRWTLVPFITLFGWLSTVLAPLVHLGHYLLSAALFPLRLLAKFETLYIYLGIAAVIGIFSGSVLHMSSTILVSLFDLAPTPEEPGRSAASVRAAREKKQLEEGSQSSSSKGKQLGNDPGLEKRYTEWLEKETGKRKEEGLLRQTILEEDDDSEDVF